MGDGTNIAVSRLQLRTDCHIDKLSIRRDRYLLLFMHKQQKTLIILKKQMFVLDSIKHLYLKPINPIMKELGKISCIERRMPME